MAFDYSFHQENAQITGGVAPGDKVPVFDASSGRWYYALGSDFDTKTPVTITAAATMTAAANSGVVNLLGEVGGNASLTVTLPAATGSGARFKFIVSVVNTSNYLIKVTGDDVMYGNIITNSTGDTPDLGQPWPTAADSDTITLNGTTTGGAAIGDWIELTDILADGWAVTGITTTSGTEATPFSATVT